MSENEIEQTSTMKSKRKRVPGSGMKRGKVEINKNKVRLAHKRNVFLTLTPDIPATSCPRSPTPNRFCCVFRAPFNIHNVPCLPSETLRFVFVLNVRIHPDRKYNAFESRVNSVPRLEVGEVMCRVVCRVRLG